MSSRAIFIKASCVGIFVLGACAPPVGAAEVVGSTLNNSPTNLICGSCSASAVQTIKVTASSLPIVPTSAGVVVSVRLKHDSSGPAPTDTFGFRLLTSAGGTMFTAHQPARLPDFQFPPNLPVGIRSFVPVDEFGRPQGSPIGAGESLGMVEIFTPGDSSGPAVLSAGAPATGAETKLAVGTHNSGTLNYNINGANVEILVQYTVEPDADGDGYGDETQDRCVGTTGPCIPIETAVKPVPTEAASFGANPKVSLELASTRINPRKKFSVIVANNNAFAVTGQFSAATREAFEIGGVKIQKVLLGAKPLSIPRGGSQTFKVGLPTYLRKPFVARGRMRISLNATVFDPAGSARAIKLPATLRPRK
jgi:hypothetical protein